MVLGYHSTLLHERKEKVAWGVELIYYQLLRWLILVLEWLDIQHANGSLHSSFPQYKVTRPPITNWVGDIPIGFTGDIYKDM